MKATLLILKILKISLGSLYETVTELRIANMENYITQEQFKILSNKAESIAKMLNALISSLKRKSNNQVPTTNN